MELVERLKEILAREYGINNEEELLKAIEDMPKVDLGIFVSPLAGGENV